MKHFKDKMFCVKKVLSAWHIYYVYFHKQYLSAEMLIITLHSGKRLGQRYFSHFETSAW